LRTFSGDYFRVSGVSRYPLSKGDSILGNLLSGRTATASEAQWSRLIEDIAKGDQSALHLLYDRTNQLVFTLVMRITGEREAAEEVTLDVFHDVWRRASTYDPCNGTVVGWIMNQARSRAFDRVRFDHRKKRSGTPPELGEVVRGADDPQDMVHAMERRVLLLNAIENLTAEERQVVETAFFSELTHHEVAEKLNQPLGTVKTRIRSALAKLRIALGRELK